MKKNLFKILAALITVLLLVSCGSPSTSSGKELVVYSPNSDGEIEGLLNYWADKNDVTVKLQNLGSGEAYKRLDGEKNNPQADVMFGGLNLGWYNQYPDIFEEYVAEGNDKLPEMYQNPNGYITSYLLSGSNLLVNTDLAAELNLEITGYADLLDPALKGKIATADPSASSSAYAQLTNILLAMGGYESDEAWDYVSKLIVQLDGKFTSGSSGVYNGVKDGEYVVGLTYEDPSVELLASGATNVEVVYPEEGAVWLPAASGLVKGAPNSEVAKEFLDWLISDEAQTIIGGMTVRPVNPDVELTNEFMKPFNEIKVLEEDMEYTLGQKDKILERWTKTLVESQ
ncbi:MAG TPA: extracellular solute-binding protein [Erysipelothrix sp.]|nr:extracellular solute-binding protein [Erysipelothrix sp.]